jgi:uncharacterized protein (DUF427 family)
VRREQSLTPRHYFRFANVIRELFAEEDLALSVGQTCCANAM